MAMRASDAAAHADAFHAALAALVARGHGHLDEEVQPNLNPSHGPSTSSAWLAEEKGGWATGMAFKGAAEWGSSTFERAAKGGRV